MMRFTGCGVVALAAVIWATPAVAVRPASLAGVAPSVAVDAQFRFPWEQRAKPKKRVKRGARPAKPTQQKKPTAAKRGKGAPVAPVAPAAPVDPMDAALPPAPGPLDVAVPRGATPRERDGWMAVAIQIAPPAVPPLLPPEGPAPAPAYIVALLATMQRPGPVDAARPQQPAAENDETPDMHVPLPPVRPRMPGETAARDERPAMRDGLAPENGLAPEGGLSPEGVPLPPRRPGGVAGLEPEGPPEPPPGPTEPDIALPVVAHDDDPDCRALVAEGVTDANRMPADRGTRRLRRRPAGAARGRQAQGWRADQGQARRDAPLLDGARTRGLSARRRRSGGASVPAASSRGSTSQARSSAAAATARRAAR